MTEGVVPRTGIGRDGMCGFRDTKVGYFDTSFKSQQVLFVLS
ncbi:MAG: hypothetical protein ACE5SW_07945 [Nitrososphaeraceae archaeon]